MITCNRCGGRHTDDECDGSLIIQNLQAQKAVQVKIDGVEIEGVESVAISVTTPYESPQGDGKTIYHGVGGYAVVLGTLTLDQAEVDEVLLAAEEAGKSGDNLVKRLRAHADEIDACHPENRPNIWSVLYREAAAEIKRYRAGCGGQ